MPRTMPMAAASAIIHGRFIEDTANRDMSPISCIFVGRAFPPADSIKMASGALALQVPYPDATLIPSRKPQGHAAGSLDFARDDSEDDRRNGNVAPRS
jgi:hypothetical protein